MDHPYDTPAPSTQVCSGGHIDGVNYLEYLPGDCTTDSEEVVRGSCSYDSAVYYGSQVGKNTHPLRLWVNFQAELKNTLASQTSDVYRLNCQYIANLARLIFDTCLERYETCLGPWFTLPLTGRECDSERLCCPFLSLPMDLRSFS